MMLIMLQQQTLRGITPSLSSEWSGSLFRVLAFIVQADLTFLAYRGFPTRMVYLYYISCLRYTPRYAVGFSSTETTFQVCLPWLNDVINPIILDVWKCPLVYCQERFSWATKRRCLCGTGKIDPGNGMPDSKKIQWFGLSCWCCPVQVLCLLDTDIHTESEQWTPPLL